MADEYHTSDRRGRSQGTLHLDKDCPHLQKATNYGASIISGPRERFADDQEVCSFCERRDEVERTCDACGETFEDEAELERHLKDEGLAW